jgi:Arc/MetJ-type ribon-helix-helix transcriptional regulator
MSKAKVAVTLPAEVLRLAKEQVTSGRAKSLSALVSEALDERVRRDQLGEILDAMDAEHGRPGKGAQAWARRVLGR